MGEVGTLRRERGQSCRRVLSPRQIHSPHPHARQHPIRPSRPARCSNRSFAPYRKCTRNSHLKSTVQIGESFHPKGQSDSPLERGQGGVNVTAHPPCSPFKGGIKNLLAHGCLLRRGEDKGLWSLPGRVPASLVIARHRPTRSILERLSWRK